jgi:hypothetical protein
MLNVIMLTFVMLNVIMLSFVMLNVIMLGFLMLNVVLLSTEALSWHLSACVTGKCNCYDHPDSLFNNKTSLKLVNPPLLNIK